MSMQFDLFTNRASVSSPAARARSTPAGNVTVDQPPAGVEYPARTCGKCGGLKTHYPNAKQGQWYCLPCVRASHRRRYQETGAAYDRARDRSKIKARKAVQHAMDAGRLSRCPCQVCGTTKSVQAHHDDYSKPLDVMWLCPTHHRARHRYLDSIQASPEGA